MSFSDVFFEMAENSSFIPCPGDYENDGIVYCGNCNTPKQCSVNFLGQSMVVGCLCKCQEEERNKRETKRKQVEDYESVKNLRLEGVIDKSLSKCRFEEAQMTNELKICASYADKWEEMKERNSGLLLWGGVGTGKTFSAACIVNRLIDRRVKAMITSFPRILSNGKYDKTEIAEKMRHYDLVVIDDLGVERDSDYALETVYMVIDERYKSGKPLIVTTNLTMEILQNPASIRQKRIYDRILEMCVPINFTGASRRLKTSVDKTTEAKSILIET